MSDIDDYRNRIDEIDREITKLFEERMNTVIKIADYKKANNLPIFNRDRENEVIEKNIGYLENNDYSIETSKFFVSLMEISRELQNRNMTEAKEAVNTEVQEAAGIKKEKGKVGFFGASGSFCEEAMLKYFGTLESPKAYDEFEDVFLAVKNEEIKYGVFTYRKLFNRSYFTSL